MLYALEEESESDVAEVVGPRRLASDPPSSSSSGLGTAPSPMQVERPTRLAAADPGSPVC